MHDYICTYIHMYVCMYVCIYPGELIITRKQIINKPLVAQKSAIKFFGSGGWGICRDISKYWPNKKSIKK